VRRNFDVAGDEDDVGKVSALPHGPEALEGSLGMGRVPVRGMTWKEHG
jgi:hypothetical protein